MSKAVLTAQLERSTCPYQRSLLSFSMRSRFSIPSHASSSVDLMVAVSFGLTLQICLIIALSFRCRGKRQDFVTGMEHCAPHTRAVHTATCLERKVAGRENWFQLLLTSSRRFTNVLWLKAHNHRLLRACLLGTKNEATTSGFVRPDLDFSLWSAI